MFTYVYILCEHLHMQGDHNTNMLLGYLTFNCVSILVFHVEMAKISIIIFINCIMFTVAWNTTDFEQFLHSYSHCPLFTVVNSTVRNVSYRMPFKI